jgi:hypothetical protein
MPVGDMDADGFTTVVRGRGRGGRGRGGRDDRGVRGAARPLAAAAPVASANAAHQQAAAPAAKSNKPVRQPAPRVFYTRNPFKPLPNAAANTLRVTIGQARVAQGADADARAVAQRRALVAPLARHLRSDAQHKQAWSLFLAALLGGRDFTPAARAAISSPPARIRVYTPALPPNGAAAQDEKQPRIEDAFIGMRGAAVKIAPSHYGRALVPLSGANTLSIAHGYTVVVDAWFPTVAQRDAVASLANAAAASLSAAITIATSVANAPEFFEFSFRMDELKDAPAASETVHALLERAGLPRDACAVLNSEQHCFSARHSCYRPVVQAAAGYEHVLQHELIAARAAQICKAPAKPCNVCGRTLTFFRACRRCAKSGSGAGMSARTVLCFHCHTRVAPSHIGACPDREKPPTCAHCARDHFTLRCPLLRRRHEPLRAEQAPQRQSRRRRNRGAPLVSTAMSAAAAAVAAPDAPWARGVRPSTGRAFAEWCYAAKAAAQDSVAEAVYRAAKNTTTAEERIMQALLALQTAVGELTRRLSAMEDARAASVAPVASSAPLTTAPAGATAARASASAAAAPATALPARSQLSGYFTAATGSRTQPAAPPKTTKRSSTRAKGASPQAKRTPYAPAVAPHTQRDILRLTQALTAAVQHDADADDLASDGGAVESQYFSDWSAQDDR